MTNLKRYSEIVDVKTRFGRSVNLERDFYSQVSLDGYVLTTTATQALTRITQALSNKSSERAFTLTGPYGTGKSTFALFAAKSFEGNVSSSPAIQILSDRAPDLAKTYQKIKPELIPILVSGSREPIAFAILRGIRNALTNSADKAFKQVLDDILVLEKEKSATGKQIVRILEQMSSVINVGGTQKGFLVVIDELGKLLEYTAINPEKSDIFVLQELAEATRTFETPFFLITILHQAFERYAERLGRHERVEWQKIQGRFEDLAFHEPNEQVLHILETAFEINQDLPQAKQIRKHGEELGERAFDLGLCGRFKKTACTNLLKNCVPLHPTVSLTLGHIFRRFGQNERSLFAFLTSNEAFGLKDFLQNNNWDMKSPVTVRLDRVYDYLIAAMGSALYAGAESRKWAEIESALTRLADPNELEVRLLKTIGLLGVIGELGNLKSSGELLKFALEDSSVSSKAIDQALRSLHKESVITERRYNDTFAIWEGSDVDLDGRFRESEKNVDPNASLAENLTENFEARPIVAKRHSDESGTLRFFEIAYTDPANLDEKSSEPIEDADGRILYVLTGNEDERQKLIKQIIKNRISPKILIAIPQNLANLRDAVFNVACWKWVGRNTPELESDRAARTELAARLFEAEHAVNHWIGRLQTDTTEENCLWFWDRAPATVPNAKGLQLVLSEICNRTFSKAPVLKNELLNRRNLSSSATSARRLLFEAMVQNKDLQNLGIEGYPPQLSMYLSILNKTGLHREEKGKFGFYPPTTESDLKALWDEIEAFLNTTEFTRRTVEELFEMLQTEPFGLKDGIIPVLFLSAFLHFDAEVALYEKGSFIPHLTLPILERMCKNPSTFTVQLCRIGEVRSKVIEKLAEKLLPENIASEKEKLEILTLVKPLARFAADLNEFSKFTRRISPKAQKIRQALTSAREPDRLLFEKLPEACGFQKITSKTSLSTKDAENLAKKLQAGLAELKRAYPNLLEELERMLASAFGLQSKREELRKEISSRVKLVSEYAVSPKLKSFIIRSGDEDTELSVWLESLGALLSGKPVPMWHDDEIAQFEINLAETARAFLRLEALTFELSNRDGKNNIKKGSKLMRISLTRLGESEAEQIVTMSEHEQAKAEELAEQIDQIFEDAGLNGNTNLRLTILANLSYKLMNRTN